MWKGKSMLYLPLFLGEVQGYETAAIILRKSWEGHIVIGEIGFKEEQL